MKILDNILVSIVIPSYNHGDFISSALQSVFNQTYTNWEVIIVDNYSTDKTKEVISKFVDDRVYFIQNHNNGIIAISRNVGIRASKGDWIAFLDSDDLWHNTKLQECMNPILDGYYFIYHELKIIKNPATFFKTKVNSWQARSPILIDLLVRGNPIATSSVVVKKSLLENVDYFPEDPNMVTAEDYSTWLHASILTEKFKYLPKVLGFYRIHSQSSSSSRDMSVPARYAALEFIHLLNSVQYASFAANLKYISGLYYLSRGDYSYALNKLSQSFDNSRLTVKFKCAIFLTFIFFLRFINFAKNCLRYI